MNSPAQCKDIPEAPILRFLAKHKGKWATHWPGMVMPCVMEAMPSGTPEKLGLAKMRMLLQRDVVTGRGCGCRGDWEITEKGEALLRELEAKP